MSGETRVYTFALGEFPADAALALLAELDFDAFEERGGRLLAYVPERLHDRVFAQAVHDICTARGFTATSASLPDENWNQRWEDSFEPAEVDDFLRIRAPFHAPSDAFEIELEIVPEMSFGTGHHETTHMMAQLLRERPPFGKTVHDFGTGTGVLAMVAARQGARYVAATDYDPRCVASALANAARNGIRLDLVGHGDVDVMPPGPFDLTLANIQRGVLVRAMPALQSRCLPGGELWLSGVLADDLARVDEAAAAAGFRRLERRRRGPWLACRYGVSTKL